MSIRTEAAPLIAGTATVALAAVAWVAVLTQGSMMSTSPGLVPFAATWVVMMAAMMLPSAAPFVMAFARRNGAWTAWPVLVAAYLFVWTVVGVGLYLASAIVPLPEASGLVVGLAIAFAGLYALTPLKRAGQAQCLQMCSVTGRVAGRALQAAGAEGLVYGVNCVLCSAGVMIALFLIGTVDVRVMLLAAALVLLYKIESRFTGWLDLASAVALVMAGVGVLLQGANAILS